MSTAADCFHCGEPLPDAAPIFARIDEHDQPMCCIGCKAVAELIHNNGLGAFYEFRSQPQAGMDLRPEEHEFVHFDSADLLSRYVHRGPEMSEVTLDIGGMYCSACVWLLDNALQKQPAIRSIDVNPASHRAVISWDSTVLTFSGLLQAIADIGFKPIPVGLMGLLLDDMYLWGELMAMSVLASIPPILIYIIGQRYVVGGFVAGGVKA